VIQLKQGIGRLIRSTRDRGVVAIFDRRLTTKQYGAYFLRSLSEWPVVHRMEQVRAFFEAQPDGGAEREGGAKTQENG
jgi:ATP-dependent DNA helicase DinG